MASSSSSFTLECSICLNDVSDGCGRTVVKLRCDHVFHLDCIGSAFNAKGAMECPICRVNENGVWRRNFGSPTPEQNVADEADQDVDVPQESIPMGPHGNVLHPHYGCFVRLSYAYGGRQSSCIGIGSPALVKGCYFVLDSSSKIDWEDAWGSTWGYGNAIEQFILDATNQWNSSFMMSDVIPMISLELMELSVDDDIIKGHTDEEIDLQMGPFLSGYGNAINPHAGNANTHQWNGPPVPTEVPDSPQRYGLCNDCINRISVQRYGICNDCLNHSSMSDHAGIPVPPANLRVSSADGNGIPIPSAGFNGIQNDMRMPRVIVDEILNQSADPQVDPQIIFVHHIHAPYPGYQAVLPYLGHPAAPPQPAPPAPSRNHNRRTA
ncbi:hypothetical protein M0R45_020964 [Rubus argutus]|uniref:RING-type domain-containing protein n=1 Tax=Rubus argutus TaxID=59490 RepID=A0AAW1X9W3_RUBAR